MYYNLQFIVTIRVKMFLFVFSLIYLVAIQFAITYFFIPTIKDLFLLKNII